MTDDEPTDSVLKASELEALKARIMTEIEAKLSQKEEGLWRRGQVEIRRLHQEQKHLTGCVGRLQERQATFVAESQKIRGALLDVTSKFETVVKEMRDVLRALPPPPQPPQPSQQRLSEGRGSGGGGCGGEQPSPSPSAASTCAASEAAARVEEPPCEATPGGSTVGGTSAELSAAAWSAERGGHRMAAHTPLPMWHIAHDLGETGFAELSGIDEDEFAGCGDPMAFFTPPRPASIIAAGPCSVEGAAGGQQQQRGGDFLLPAPPPPLSWRGGGAAASPAVLSLVSALPSSSAAALTTPLTPQQPQPSQPQQQQPSPPPPPPPHQQQQQLSPGLKQLHLAECLEQEAAAAAVAAAAAAGGATAAAPLPSSVDVAAAATATTAAAAAPPCRPGQPGQLDIISIELVKEPGFVTLGMEVNEENATTLRIESIDEHGLVGRYNSRQESEVDKVQIGDRIIEANGIKHDPGLMMQECKAQQRVAMTLARERWPAAAPAAASSTGSGSGGGAASSAVEGAAVEGGGKESSPLATRLRPEARVFVPSAQKEAARWQVPPGFESYEAGGLSPGLLLEASSGSATTEAPSARDDSFSFAASSSDNPEDVKRALFP